MTTNPHNPKESGSAEETLRIIASLPVPAGLEDRVHTALRKSHRSARVLAWPTGLKPQSNWVRTAAAAAIVFVVAGGGWGVYTRVQQNQPGKVIVMPQRIAEPSGFSGAGAIRTPQTLPGPKAPQQPKMQSAQPTNAQPQAAKKPAKKAPTASSPPVQAAGQK